MHGGTEIASSRLDLKQGVMALAAATGARQLLGPSQVNGLCRQGLTRKIVTLYPN